MEWLAERGCLPEPVLNTMGLGGTTWQAARSERSYPTPSGYVEEVEATITYAGGHQPPSQVSNMKIPNTKIYYLSNSIRDIPKTSTDLQLKTALKHGCLRCEGCSVGLRGDEINISKRGKSCDLFPPPPK